MTELSPGPELGGRTALVTGAARGMGLAIARRLARNGARIAINDIGSADLDAAVEELRTITDDVLAVPADVTSPADIAGLVDTVRSAFGPIGILVNNAGVLRPTKFLDIEPEEWAFVMGVNVTGTYLCTRAALPHMLEVGWGRVINLSSTAGKNVSTVGGAHYTAAKAAILGVTRAVAAEFADKGITVNAVCPGLIDTDMVRQTINPERTEAYARGFPIPRLGRPEEVADLVAFLAGPQAAYITGASLDINGGDLMI